MQDLMLVVFYSNFSLKWMHKHNNTAKHWGQNLHTRDTSYDWNPLRNTPQVSLHDSMKYSSHICKYTIRYRTKIKRKKIHKDIFIKANLKQSDNMIWACFVWSSLLRLGKSDGILARFANRTGCEMGARKKKWFC